MRALLRERTEAVALAALVVIVLLVGLFDEGGLSAGIVAVGVVSGALLALHALGLVLVYRANRVINFAQLQMGGVGAMAFVELVQRRTFLTGLAAVCPPCLPAPKTVGDLAATGVGPRAGALLDDPALAAAMNKRLDDPDVVAQLPEGFSARDFAVDIAPDWLVQLNWVLSLIVAVALAGLLVWGVYVLIVKRFSAAPRLVLTVVTIGAGVLAQGLGAFTVATLFADQEGRPPAQNAAFPSDVSLQLDPAVLSATDLIIAVLAAAVGVVLFLFLRRTRSGVVLRGAAENPLRAQTLGVNVNAVAGRAWLIAGLLSGLAAALGAAQQGLGAAQSYDTIVRSLGAAVVGGLTGLPLALAGALAIGAMTQVLLQVVAVGAINALLLVVIVVLLLAQRARAGRAEHEAHASWIGTRELRGIPSELRALAPVRTAKRVLIVLLAAVVLGYPWYMSPANTSDGVLAMTWAVMGLSLLVLTGWAGQISLAQVAFASIGAWVAAVSGLPFVLALLAGGLVGAAVAAAVGVPALRLRGQYLAIGTLAFSLAASHIVLTPEYLGRHLPTSMSRPVLLGIDFQDVRAFYYLTLAFTAAMVLFTMGLRRSRTARALIAAKDNELAAQAFGINLLRARLGAFALSGFMAAVAGGFFAFGQLGVDRESFAPAANVQLFLVAIVGGLGSVAGPLVGAAYYNVLRMLGSSDAAFVADILVNPGLGVILVLLMFPNGLAGGLYAVRDMWLRRVASRHHISVPTLVADRDAGGAAPIAPKTRQRGAAAFVPLRYRVTEQWMMEHQRRVRADG